MLPVLILRISNSPTSSNVKMILKKDMFWGETYDQAYPVLKVFIPYAPCIVYLPTLSWFVKKMCANVQVSMILSKFKVPTHPLKVKKYWGGRRHFSMFARQRWYRLEIWRVDYMMCGLHMHFKGCNSHMNSRAEAVYLLNLSGIFPADQVWKVTIIPFSQSRHAAGRKKDHQITIPEPPQPHQRGGFQISSAAGMPSAAELFFFFFFGAGGVDDILPSSEKTCTTLNITIVVLNVADILGVKGDAKLPRWDCFIRHEIRIQPWPRQACMVQVTWGLCWCSSFFSLDGLLSPWQVIHPPGTPRTAFLSCAGVWKSAHFFFPGTKDLFFENW